MPVESLGTPWWENRSKTVAKKGSHADESKHYLPYVTCRTTILKTALAPAIGWIQHGLCDQVKLTVCWMQVAKFVLSRRKTVIPRNRLVKWLQRAHAEVPLTCLEMDDFYLSPAEFPSVKIVIWAVYWVGWMHSKTITLQLQQQFQLLSHQSLWIFIGSIWQAPSLPI